MSQALNIATQNFVRYFADRPTQRPSDWCEKRLRFDEDDNHGPFSFAGSEYCRELVDDFGNTAVNDSVNVFGSQSRKTGSLMGGVAWCAENDPCGIFWVMPSIDLARTFSRKRLMPMLRASDGTRHLIPKGADRHDFKTLDLKLGAASILLTGSNSPANLASTPRRRVILDEVDKFDTGGGGEADAADLARQRTKNQPNPQRFETSTPTVVEGLIWQDALKGDMRRYFVPAPCCGRNHPDSRRIILAWSAPFTVLPKVGCEAFVVWDQEAKRPDGSWDIERVERSARFRCPHCGGDILDAHKTWMNREGIWQPTRKAAPGFISRQLPSLYACAPETTVGKLAKKFLEQKNSLLGLQGFINGDLAEPYQSQDRQSERMELITQRVDVTAEWQPALTVDCQGKSPHFWYVKRNWNAAESVGVEAGSADTWDDLRTIQNRVGAAVPDDCVIVDSGFGARSDADVYANCANFGQLLTRGQGLKPLHFGWLPAKGFPVRKRWKDPDSGLLVPYYLRGIDPFLGTSAAGRVEMSLFEFSGEFFKDILEAMRRGKGNSKWSVLESAATEEYWRHLDAKIKLATLNKRTGQTTHQWTLRSAHWPDHLDDCEIIQAAYANFRQLFTLPEQ